MKKYPKPYTPEAKGADAIFFIVMLVIIIQNFVNDNHFKIIKLQDERMDRIEKRLDAQVAFTTEALGSSLLFNSKVSNDFYGTDINLTKLSNTLDKFDKNDTNATETNTTKKVK